MNTIEEQARKIKEKRDRKNALQRDEEQIWVMNGGKEIE